MTRFPCTDLGPAELKMAPPKKQFLARLVSLLALPNLLEATISISARLAMHAFIMRLIMQVSP